jgi:hypothetical protein
MEIFRKYFVVILLTIIVCIVWGGITLFSGRISSSINPNAEVYVKPLNPKFDEEIIEEVSERTKESFPISPEDFEELNPQTSD